MTSEQPQRWWKRLLILPPVVVGVLVVIYAGQGKQPPQRTEVAETVRKVRVVTVPVVDLVPVVEAAGTVRAERTWNAVVQVAGRIVELHPQLRDGAIVAAGEQLVRIDPTLYELALAQSEAELAQLDASEKNLAAALQIARQNLAIAEKELARQRRLLQQGTVSQKQVDDAENAMLAARQSVQTQESGLAVLPAQRRLAEAKAAQSRLDLANTVISAPFDMRIDAPAVELSQFVPVGERLFRGDYIGRVEIEAQVTVGNMRSLMIGRRLPAFDAAALAAADVPALLGVQARVRFVQDGLSAEWPAQIVRFNTIDTRTRTVGVVVAVDGPYRNAVPGVRPPLLNGMFVDVELRGAPQPGRVVVPRAAVRDGAVHVVDADNRLRKRRVQVLFSLGGLSAIAEGLQGGELLVVSDLVPAVEGMALAPVADAALAERILAAAGGERTP